MNKMLTTKRSGLAPSLVCMDHHGTDSKDTLSEEEIKNVFRLLEVVRKIRHRLQEKEGRLRLILVGCLFSSKMANLPRVPKTPACSSPHKIDVHQIEE